MIFSPLLAQQEVVVKVLLTVFAAQAMERGPHVV